MSYEELFNYVSNLEENDDPCLICYQGKKEDLPKLSCGHQFHQECLKNLNSCPYCGKKINQPKSILKKNINTCQVILKSGNKKGQVCGRINCGYHKNIV